MRLQSGYLRHADGLYRIFRPGSASARRVFARFPLDWRNTARTSTAAWKISNISTLAICCCRSATRRVQLDIIGEFVRGVLEDGKMPVGLGGEHLVSWPIFQEVYKKYPDMAIIHFDAHADLRESL